MSIILRLGTLLKVPLNLLKGSWLLVFILLAFFQQSNAQTTLAAGDLAILGFTGDADDDFHVLFLIDVESGTEITFTDNGWLPESGEFRTSEATWTYTTTSAISAGTVMTALTDMGLNISSNISSSGDQISIYQGSVNVFIAAGNSTEFATTDADANDSNITGIPSGLTEGTTAVAAGQGSGLEDEWDNIWYSGATNSGTKEELLAAIGDVANWSGSNSRGDYAPVTSFTVNSGSTPTLETSVSSLTDFGTISNGSSSSSQSYTVSGSNLTADVTVTAPSNFEVSTDDTNFSSSVTLPFGDVNSSAQTVYARFTPTSGTNQTITGNITHASTDATDVNVSVSGTETGNAGNNPPTDIALSSSDINENQDIGTTVGSLSTTDADSGDSHTYTLVSGDGDDDNASFAIDGSNLNSAEVFDFETKSSYAIRIQTDDGNGGTTEEAFTITINDINDAPTDISLSNSYIDDGTTSGTTVGTLSSTDQESGDTHTYTLVSGDGDTDNGSFAIDGTNLNITTDADFNTKSSYSIRIQSDDGNEGIYAEAITITVQDLTALLIDENFDYGETAGDLTTVSGGNWTDHSGSTAVGYATTSLSMTDYGSSGVGGSATFTGSNSQDVNRVFTAQSMNSVYVSALINLSSASTSENYFYHFRNSGGAFYGRVYAKDDGSGNLNLGIRDNSDGTIVYSSTSYSYDTDYLLVLKYDLSAGEASIYVMTAVAYSEPGTADAVSSDGTDPSELAAIALRQSSNIPTGTIDGIRIGKSWGSLFPATLSTSVTSLTDFGSVDNGSSSASQSYTVSGSNLTSDVTVNAPSNFEVSTDDTNFSSSVTLAFADVNSSAQTVYVRFTPTSGANQALNGNVQNINAAASTINVAVSGTETGNNATPTDISITSTTVDENQELGTIVGTLSTTDADEGDSHTYSLVDDFNRSIDNGSFTIDGSTLKTNEVFNHETKDSYSIRIRTDDGNGGIYEEDFTITVNDINDTPTLDNIIDDQTTAEDSEFTYQFAENTFSDEDSDALTYTATLDDDSVLPTWLTFTAGTRTFSGTPTNDHVGTINVKVVADDSNGGTANDVFQIEVTNTNDAPTFTSSPLTSAVQDIVYTYNIETEDVDAGTTLVITATTKPDWLNFTDNSDGTATLTGTPDNTHVGEHNVVLSVTDNIATAVTQEFTITVVNTNDAPEFTSTPVTSVNEDALYTYNITASDNDAGANLSFGSVDLPSWLTLNDNNDGTATLTGTPTNDQVGDTVVTITLTDGIIINPIEQNFTIAVINVNDTPVFVKGADQTINEDAGAQTVAAWATGINDGDDGTQTLTFNVSNDNNSLFSAQPTIDEATGELSYTPANNANGMATVTVSLSDDGGTANSGVDTSADQTFTITVNAVNDAPVFVKGTDQTVDEDAGAQTVAAWATGINDGDDGTQTLTFNVSNDNNALFSGQPTIDAATGQLSYTPAGNANGMTTVTVSLSDNGGTENSGVDTSADQTFTITVNAINDAPEFTSSEVTSVDEDATYTYNITASDADADATLVITATTKPDWLNFTDNGDGTASLTGTPDNSHVGDHNVVLEVTDNIANATTQEFTVTVVNTNDAPNLSTMDDIALCPGETSDERNLIFFVSDDDVPSGDTFTFEQSSTPLTGVEVDITDDVLTVTHNATVSGSFDITVTVFDAAGATASSTFTVTINYLDVTISQNENELTAPSGDSYRWFRDGSEISGATAQTYKASEIGNYTVEVTYGDCAGTSAAVNIDGPTGLDFEDFSTQFGVYPNPAENFIYFDSQIQLKGNVTLQLTDLNGKTILMKNELVEKLDISSLPKGIYILQLINENKRAIKRILKN